MTNTHTHIYTHTHTRTHTHSLSLSLSHTHTQAYCDATTGQKLGGRTLDMLLALKGHFCVRVGVHVGVGAWGCGV